MPRRNLLGRRSGTPAEPIDDTAQLLAKLVQTRNERAALTQQLRDTARERDRFRDERDAARVMLAAAKRLCAANCEHAQDAARKAVQLVEMQRVQNRLQAANQAYTEADLKPAPAVKVPRPRSRR